MKLHTQTLETSRLLLRPFQHTDAVAMFNNWAGDPEVTKYVSWPTHPSEEASAERIKFLISQYDCGDTCDWAIVLKDIDTAIGSIGAVISNPSVKSVNIGYAIGKKWWHRGITTEALQAVLNFLFEECDVNRVEAWHDTRNPNSGKVMQKCGMKFEGIHRSADEDNMGICDVAWYGLLKQD